jgi:ketosteroid isomerase-like protein
VLVLFQFVGSAQNSHNSKDEAEVIAQVERFRQALIDPDAKELAALTSKNLSYGHSSGTIQDQATFIDKLVNGDSDFVSVEFQNQTVEITANVAIVRHNLAAHTKGEGVEKDIKIGVMLVWQKEKNKWLLIARQAYKVPS